MYAAQYYVHDYIYYNCNLYTYSKYEQCDDNKSNL